MVSRKTKSPAGLYTINVPEELDATCVAAHNRFLVKRGLAEWTCLLTLHPEDQLTIESFTPSNESIAIDLIRLDPAKIDNQSVDVALSDCILEILERHHTLPDRIARVLEQFPKNS